ncbi:MAG: hypothetical protein DRQ47_00330 [Gammaproteobacteria bacterium]|nr:MAG: hypothetical protein DRQ47_00330 [Gammaproteobacteria bacterium]
MATSTPTIHELAQELLGIVKPLPEFDDRGFSIYDLTDLNAVLKYETLPLVGVSYEGRVPVSEDAQGKTLRARTVTIMVVNFSVIVALRYGSAVGVDDTKVDAVNLLNAISDAVLGYKGVNHRGWVFKGESPLPSDIEGVIFYGQTWSVRLPVTGNFGI